VQNPASIAPDSLGAIGLGKLKGAIFGGDNDRQTSSRPNHEDNREQIANLLAESDFDNDSGEVQFLDRDECCVRLGLNYVIPGSSSIAAPLPFRPLLSPSKLVKKLNLATCVIRSGFGG
jgi:hypothetical protein